VNLSSDQGFNNAAEFCRKVRTINDEMFGHQPSSPIRIDVTVKSSQYPIVVRVTRPLGLGAEALQKII
jgi:hypothetical protein